MNSTLRRLLCGTSTLVLGGMLGGAVAGPAAAADVRFELPNLASATGHVAVNLGLSNEDVVSASIDDATVGQEDIHVGEGDPVTATVAENILNATAIGNRIARNGEDTVDLGLLGTSGDGDGIAVLGASVNHGGAAVQSSVTDSELAIAVTGLTEGSASNTGNEIAATTLLNSSHISASGQIPNDHVSATAGSISLGYGPPATENELTARGDVAVSNVQLNDGAGPGAAGGSYARAENNGIGLSVATTPSDPPVTSSLSLSDNSVSASYAGNAASTGVSAETGDAPAFAGAASLATVQSNLGGGADAENAAENLSSQITADVGNDSAVLSGALAVSGNSVSSSATGNQALAGEDGGYGNSVILADGLSFTGAGGDPAGSSVDYTGGGVEAGVTADLGLLSSQANVDTAHRSLTDSAEISAAVRNVDGGSVDLSGNAVSASGTGNVASSAIEAGGTATASFNGSAALANAQVNYRAPVSAAVSETEISATVGDTGDGNLTDGSVTLDGNRAEATAGGNRGTNRVGIGAANLSLPGGLGNIVAGDLRDSSNVPQAGVTLSSTQANYSADVEATNELTSMTVRADNPAGAVSGAALMNKDGRINATVEGNRVTNDLTLNAGSTLQGSAALSNLQANDDSDVSATVSDAEVAISAGSSSDIGNSAFEMTGNTVRATARGSAAANSLSAAATNAMVPEAGEVASAINLDPDHTEGRIFDANHDALPTVNAGFALLNSQGMSGDVSAEAIATDTPFSISLTGNATNVNAAIGRPLGELDPDSLLPNLYIVDAYANQASNGMSLDVSATLAGESGYAPVANVTNVQTRANDSGVTASVGQGGQGGQDETTFEIGVTGDASNAQLFISGNVAQALARGNLASGNSLTVKGNDVTAASEDQLGGMEAELGTGSDLTADLAFTVQNAQAGGTGEVSATHDGTGALLDVGEDVIGSGLAMDGNAFLAGAYDNDASNRLSIEATTLTASGGVQSFQTSGAETSASVGTADSITGLTISVTGAVSNSSLSISETMLQATAASNTAVNSVSVKANALDGGAGIDPGEARTSISQGDGLHTALADYAVSNIQVLEDAGSATAVASSDLGIRTGGTISDTALSVSDNFQQASAHGNKAINDLVIDVNGTAVAEESVAPTAGVLSSQDAVGSAISADSRMAALAPGAVDGSSLTLSGNTNAALAVANDAVSVLTASGTILDSPNGATPANASVEINGLATADYVVNSAQGAAGTVGSTAKTTVSNTGSGAGSLVTSSAVLDGNVTAAEATANRAGNVLNLDAGSTLAATGAVLNSQSSSSEVSASAGSTVSFALTATNAAAASASSVSVRGNRTTAVARGNSASNALNALASAVYAPGATNGAEATTIDGGPRATATYAVLNSQTNDGNVTASAVASYDVAFNAVDQAAGSVFGSSVAVSGNRIAADAAGNVASNSIVLNSRPGVMPSAAVMNIQSNTAAITATVDEARIGVPAGLPGAIGSGFRVGGNQITATAVGNSATGSITASR